MPESRLSFTVGIIVELLLLAGAFVSGIVAAGAVGVTLALKFTYRQVGTQPLMFILLILHCAAGIIVELLLLIGTIISGIVAAGAVGVALARWDNICILNADVTCSPNPDPKYKYKYHFEGSSSLCHFCVNLQIVGVISTTAFGVYRIVVLVSRRCNIAMLRIVTTGVFGLFSIFVLANAAIISAGLASFCDKLQNACQEEYRSVKCAYFQTHISWDESDIDGSSFYSTMKVAEAAAWISFLFWFCLAILSLVLFIKARRAADRQMVTATTIQATTRAAGPDNANRPL